MVSATAMLFFYPMFAFTAPSNGQVVKGAASISQSGNTTTINQGSARAVIDWQGFNINYNELVKFNQPSASAVVLNRVTGGDPTSILGQLSANGRVFITNPNGILFGAGSKIDVAGLVATTLSISNDDFMSGKNLFSQDLTKANSWVVNQGEIHIADNGFCFLVAPGVSNQGTIVAQLGKVVLASGKELTIDFNGDGLTTYTISGKVLDSVIGPDGQPISSGVSNSGKITARGGDVVLVGNAGGNVFSSVVNNSGIIEATALDVQDGTVLLSGGTEGITQNSGTIDVSGKLAGQKGGTVEVLGDKVGLFDGTRIDASGDAGGGTVLVGGDYQGKNPDVQNASRTFVGSDAKINADAIGNGDGGKVVVWSNEITGFYGNISARGGLLGGNGGVAEVSGKVNLYFNGSVDLLAPQGTTGTLLLDPYSMTIGGFWINPDTYWYTITDNPKLIFADDVIPWGDNCNITTGTLTGLLATTDVIVQTGGFYATQPGGVGDLTVADSVLWHSSHNLTLMAYRDIIVNPGASIQNTYTDVINNGSGGMDLIAGRNVQLGASLYSTYGNVRVSAPNGVIAQASGAGVGGNRVTLDGAFIMSGWGSGYFNTLTTNLDVTSRFPGWPILIDNNSATLTDLSVSINQADVHLINIGGGHSFDFTSNTLTSSGLTNLTFTNTGGPVNMGNTYVGNTLNVNAYGGSISQSGGGTVTVSGTTTLYARSLGSPSDITLDSPGNVFSGAVNTDGRNVTIVDGAGGLLLGNTIATGDLVATSAGGPLTNAAFASISVTGNSSLTGSSINIGTQLLDSFNTGTLTFNSVGPVSISENSDTWVSGSNTAGSLSLNSMGALDSATFASISVTGNSSLSGTSINIGNQLFDMFNTGTLTFNSPGAVSISEDSATQVSGPNTAGSLSLSSAGTLDNTAFASINVIGNSSLGGTSINIGNQFLDTFTTGSLTFNSTGAVNISEDDSTLLSGISRANSLTLASLGSISNDSTMDLRVTNNSNFTGTSISIVNQYGDYFTTGSLTFNSPGSVNITEDDSTLLVGTSTANSLTLLSAGGISNDGTMRLTVTNNSNLTGTSINLGNQSGDVFNTGTLSVYSSGDVSIQEDSDTVFTNSNYAGNLTLVSAGSVTNTPETGIIVLGNTNLRGTSINIGNQTDTYGDPIDLFVTGSLTFNSRGDVSISEDDGTLVTGTNTAANLNLFSQGTLTNTEFANITVSGNSNLYGLTGINLGNASMSYFNTGSLTFNSPGDVSIRENSDTSITGTNTAANLTLVSTGSMANSVSSSITTDGLTSLTGMSINIGNAPRDLFNTGSLRFNSTGTVNISEDSETQLSGASTAATLTLNSAGALSNAASSSITVNGLSTLTGTSINIGNARSDLFKTGSLNFNSRGDVSISEDNAMLVAGTNTAGNLALASTGALTNASSARITVAGQSTLSGTSINVGNAAGDVFNTGALTFNSGGAVSISEDSDTLITGTNTAANLTLASAGALMSAPGSIVTVAGLSALSGTSINVGEAQIVPTGFEGDGPGPGGTSIFNTGTLSFNSRGDVYISESSSTTVAGSNTAGNLTLTSAGSLINASSSSITVTGLSALTGTSINVGNAAGDTFNTGKLNFSSGGSVSIGENSGTVLSGYSVAGSLTLISTGSITNDSSMDLEVLGRTSLTGASINLGNVAGDYFRTGSLVYSSPGTVFITRD